MTKWHENKWRDKSALVCAETREALLLLLENLNSGQRKKLMKNEQVQITEDMSGLDIGGELEEKGLINDKLLFFVQLKLSAYADDINSGVYTLNTSMEPREMMEAMSLEKEDTETEEES